MSSIAPGGIRNQLSKILASPLFANSERLSSFLRFVVEETLDGRASGVKESSVAVEVFRRETSFDPRSDSVVRVEARNLRSKLNEYYLTIGRDDPVLIELPKGSYVPVFSAAERAPVQELTPPIPRLLLAAICAIVLLGAGFWWSNRRPSVRAPALAVLPFLNLTGGEDAEYLADGLVEDLTTALSQISGLRVAARTSAFQFRGHNHDVRELGQKLGVGMILEGSVRYQGSHLKVTAQLVSAEDGYHRWSNTYERPAADATAIQAEIANAVALALGVKPGTASVPDHAPPAQALDAYWRGRYLLRGLQSRRDQSIGHFEQAVRIDPRFAAAWAALAATHAVMAFHMEGDVDAHTAKSKEAAATALLLDPANAESHVALATTAYAYDHNWPSAERSFRRAIEINPNYAWAHRGLAVGLMSQARFDEAAAELEKTRQLDPLSSIGSNEGAVLLYCSRRFDEAIARSRQTLDLDWRFYPAHNIIGNCLAAKGQFEGAVASLTEAVAQAGRDPSILASLGFAQARSGRAAEARATLKELQSRPAGTHVYQAIVHTGLGEKPAAIACLQRSFDRHETDVNFIHVEPYFDSLRNEPTFKDLSLRSPQTVK